MFHEFIKVLICFLIIFLIGNIAYKIFKQEKNKCLKN